MKINLKTSLTFLLSFIISNFLFSQTKNFSDILPKGIVATPILDTLSYLPDTLKQPVLNLLNEKNFDLAKCFIDKQIDKNEDEKIVYIRIWDVEDLKWRKASEKSNKNTSYQSDHFYSGTIEYDIETKSVKFYGDQ